MFRGRHVHTIDAKGRVSVPSRFRERIPAVDGAARVVVTPDPFGEPCLHLYPMSAWEEIERKISALPGFQKHAVRFRRRFVAHAEECEIDRAGRLLVPPYLRERARLEKDVLWAGAITKIELWSKDAWESEAALSPEEERAYRDAISEWI